MSGLSSLPISPLATRRRRLGARLWLLAAALVLVPTVAAVTAQEAPEAPEVEVRPEAPEPAERPEIPEIPEMPEIPEIPELPEIPETPEIPTRPSESQVIFGTPLTIEAHEVTKDVTVFGGPLTIQGRVIGDAVAFGGPVTVSGQVTGDLFALGGSVTLEPTAEVMGDVVSVGGVVTRHPDAQVMGSVVDAVPSFRFGEWGGFGHWPRVHREMNIEFSPWSRIAGVSWHVFCLVLLGLLLSLVLLLARRPVERIDRKVASEPWKCGLVGLLVQILFLPLLILVIVILVVSIIGIPFCLLIPFALLAAALLALVGYTAVVYRVGEVVRSRFGWTIGSPYLVLVLGLAVLHGWQVVGQVLDVGWGPLQVFAAMFYLFGCLVTYLAFTVGLGGVLLTRFGTTGSWGESAGRTLPPPPAAEPDAASYPGSPGPESPPEPPRDDWGS